MRRVTVGEARATLPELLDRVSEGKEVTITREGVPVAVVIPPDVLRALRVAETFAAAYRLHRLLADGGATSLAAKATMSKARAAALLAELRTTRSAPRTTGPAPATVRA